MNTFLAFLKNCSLPLELWEVFLNKTLTGLIGFFNMACPMYDAQNNMCKKLNRKFPEGAQLPCEYVNNPEQCPIVLMSS